MKRQGNMMVDGVPVIPNTTSNAVADIARRRKLTASLAALVESNALGYPAFSAESARIKVATGR